MPDCPRRLSAEWTYGTYMEERSDIRSFTSAKKLFSTMACPTNVPVPQQNNSCDCGLFVIRVRHCTALRLLRIRRIRADLVCCCRAQFAQRFCADLSQAPMDGIWPDRFGSAWFGAGEAGDAMRCVIRATIISLQGSHSVTAVVNSAVSDDDDDVVIVEPAAAQQGRRLRL